MPILLNRLNSRERVKKEYGAGVSIKKKIILSFLLSFSLMILLGVMAYVDFYEIMKEIRNLEATDRIRGKTLEMRRYEKNYLYGDVSAEGMVREYSGQLKYLLASSPLNGSSAVSVKAMERKLDSYRTAYEDIVKRSMEFRGTLDDLKKHNFENSYLPALIAASFREHPVENAGLIRNIQTLNAGMAKTGTTPADISGKVISNEDISGKGAANSDENKVAVSVDVLSAIGADTKTLRALGEELIVASEEMDRNARMRIEELIRVSRVTALGLIPTSFFIGLVLLLLISQGVINKLKGLEVVLAKIGMGHFPTLPVAGHMDEVDGLKVALSSMSEHIKNREEQLRHKDEELNRSRQLAALGTLASGIAHELNNPLNNIHLAAQTLSKVVSKQPYPEIIVESVSDIYSETMRVKKIVGDLLEVARSKSPVYEQLDVNRLVTDVYEKLMVSVDMTEIDFAVEGEGFILAGRRHLEQVFVNLISNAVDSMSGKGAIRVKISQGEMDVVIEVADTGPGIPAGVIDRVFEPFYTRKDKGTGLGLFIVYNNIKKHGGTIFVSSEEGKGAAFTITLPIRERSAET
ncbi:MAG: hypothetical protein HQK89_06120 [Nitrospirae bacterium]|nr:hypothetical protein [Nitrospirota bacterium]